jgi:acyl-CoA reductase-like NAD-dependent aldehyde dehydrogenase
LENPQSLTPCGAAEVTRAIAAAVAARPACTAVLTGARSKILAEVSEAITARREEFARLIAREVDKPIKLARAEADRAAATFEDASHVVATLEGSIVPLDLRPGAEGREALVTRRPAGVVTAITPFNFPLNLVAHKVAPAIAAGCPIIVKPAPAAPRTAMLLCDLVRAAGWPEAGLQVVPIASDEDAAPLVTDERIRVLSFTGSAAVGWRLRDLARGKAVALELGGNGMAIIEPDADLDHAVKRLVTGAFAYAGQVCIKVQHVLVHRTVLAAFTDRFVAAARAYPCGDVMDECTLCGPVLRERDVARILAWVGEARARGAEALCGGAANGRFVEPTVMCGVPEDVALSSEEVFGPVVTIEPYAAIDAAIARVNRSRFGLQAGVFTRDLATLRRFFAELEVGAVITNDAPTFRVDAMPYGGVKQSGLGREGVRYAIELMTERRTLVW